MSFQPVIDSLTKIVTDILTFIPHFVNGLIILIVGYLISAAIRWLVRFILQRVHLQELADRAGIVNAMRRLGIRTPLPVIIAQILFFFLFFLLHVHCVLLFFFGLLLRFLFNFHSVLFLFFCISLFAD